jgi:uncharacterized heparinase superfamily protein
MVLFPDAVDQKFAECVTPYRSPTRRSAAASDEVLMNRPALALFAELGCGVPCRDFKAASDSFTALDICPIRLHVFDPAFGGPIANGRFFLKNKIVMIGSSSPDSARLS